MIEGACSRRARYLLALVLLPFLRATAATPEDEPEVFAAGAIEIIDPWASSGIGEAHAAAVFFAFRNRSGKVDRLLAASTPVASGGVRLRAGPGHDVAAIEIPADGSAHAFTRNGHHLALEGLTVPLTMGRRFPLELRFASAGTVTVTVTSRFHSPQLARQIRDAARRGDTAALKRLQQ